MVKTLRNYAIVKYINIFFYCWKHIYCNFQLIKNFYILLVLVHSSALFFYFVMI